jgi:hypothetical protein
VVREVNAGEQRKEDGRDAMNRAQGWFAAVDLPARAERDDFFRHG